MSAPEPLILITNDDGIDAPGIRALEGALAPLGRIRTVAPLMEQSAASRRITLRRPLRYEQQGEGRFGVEGTPTDSVMMAITLLLEELPALVVAGINAGRALADLPLVTPPLATAHGALVHYITTSDARHFQPMNTNFGLFPPLPAKIRDKEQKRRMIHQRAIDEWQTWKQQFSLS